MAYDVSEEDSGSNILMYNLSTTVFKKKRNYAYSLLSGYQSFWVFS